MPPARDHVRVREHEPVRRDHDARARAAAADTQVRHRRAEPLGHAHHHLRVGVQRSHLQNDSDLCAGTVPGGARPHASRRRADRGAARARRVLLDRPLEPVGRGDRAARRGSRPAPGRARGHARVRPAAEARPVRPPRAARLLHGPHDRRPGVAGRAAGGPHLPLRRIHGHRPARRVHDHRRAPPPARREPAPTTRRCSSTAARRAHRRLLPGDRGARGADRRARGRGARPARAANISAAATGSSSACTSSTGWSPPSATSSRRAREAILGLEGLKLGARPYLRDIGDHLVQVAGEFQRQIDDLHGADADLLQRELGPAQPGRHAADDRRHAVHPLHGRDRASSARTSAGWWTTSTPRRTS